MFIPRIVTSPIKNTIIPISPRMNGSLLLINRFNSNATKAIDPNSIFVISLPITTKKSYLYCNHQPHVVGPTKAHHFPLLTRLESKATGVAIKVWDKISTSKATVNVKITALFKKVLDTVAYQENCLRSFPSKNAMIREINEESMVQNRISQLNLQQQVNPIPLYHPSFQDKSTILEQTRDLMTSRYATHKKYMILCGIAVPISLPFAIVPVVPNIPGFYFAYRFYCNLKAFNGIKHLEYLVDSPETHLTFSDRSTIDDIYLKGNTKDELSYSVQEEERLIISKGIIDELTDALNLPQLNEELNRALRQESARLKKEMKVDDAVE